MVEDESCQFGAWGYCRSQDGAVLDVLPTSAQHGHCTDVENWHDLDEESCSAYAHSPLSDLKQRAAVALASLAFGTWLPMGR